MADSRCWNEWRLFEAERVRIDDTLGTGDCCVAVTPAGRLPPTAVAQVLLVYIVSARHTCISTDITTQTRTQRECVKSLYK